MNTTAATTLDQKIADFVAYLQEVLNKHYEQYDNLEPPTLKTYRGRKFVKITRIDNQEMVLAFIAIQSSYSKALGQVETGDIMKPAGWSAPARHARGNIFNTDNGEIAVDSTGHIVYLR